MLAPQSLPPRPPEHPLTPRELECLGWAARGKTYAEMAIILGVSFAAIKTHLDAARYKLNCSNITHAVAVAVATGVIDLGEDPRPRQNWAKRA